MSNLIIIITWRFTFQTLINGVDQPEILMNLPEGLGLPLLVAPPETLLTLLMMMTSVLEVWLAG